MRPRDVDLPHCLFAVEFGDMDGSIVALCGAYGFSQRYHLTVHDRRRAEARHADDKRYAADERNRSHSQLPSRRAFMSDYEERRRTCESPVEFLLNQPGSTIRLVGSVTVVLLHYACERGQPHVHRRTENEKIDNSARAKRTIDSAPRPLTSC